MPQLSPVPLRPGYRPYCAQREFMPYASLVTTSIPEVSEQNPPSTVITYIATPFAVRRDRPRRPSAIVVLALGVVSALALMAVIRDYWSSAAATSGANSAMRLVMMESQRCATSSKCGSTIAEIAQQVTDAGFAVPEDRISLELVFDSGRVTCSPVAQCRGKATRWKHAAGGRSARLESVTVTTSYDSVLPFSGPVDVTSTATPETVNLSDAKRR